jgi:sugar (pentulose or hexulose) kinase
MDKLLLAVDCGTQSLRALIFDSEGNLHAAAKVEYEPYSSPHPGWAEQDAEVYWLSLCQACQKLKNSHQKLFANIAGIAITTQRDTVINVDKKGVPLRPAILWLDQRKAEVVSKLSMLDKLKTKLVGMQEAVAIIQAEGKVNWLKAHQPEIWAETYKYLQVSGFLNYRLTGNYVDSVASQIGHMPFDYKRQCWADSGELASIILSVEDSKLVELVKPGVILGTLTEAAAQASGLRVELPVFAAGSDAGCATLGTGCIGPGTASLSFGTTATVQTTSRCYREPIRFMPAYPAVLPGQFNLEVQVYRGYWMINWFKKEFGLREMQEAKRLNVSPEKLLDNLLRAVPPGAMGLVLQPFWGPGLKSPEAKGAMIGFGDVHNRAHMYRAIIEGLGYSLLDGLHKIEKCSRVSVGKIMLSGGASQSNEICQIAADIFNRPATRGVVHEASGLGAAIVAAVSLGWHKSFEEAVVKMVHPGSEFRPDPQRAHIYKQLYSRVYRRMYNILKPLYIEIRNITGYPEKIR